MLPINKELIKDDNEKSDILIQTYEYLCSLHGDPRKKE